MNISWHKVCANTRTSTEDRNRVDEIVIKFVVGSQATYGICITDPINCSPLILTSKEVYASPFEISRLLLY